MIPSHCKPADCADPYHNLCKMILIRDLGSIVFLLDSDCHCYFLIPTSNTNYLHIYNVT